MRWVKGGQSNKSGPWYGSGYQLLSLAIQGQIVQTNTENIAGKVYNGLELQQCFCDYLGRKQYRIATRGLHCAQSRLNITNSAIAMPLRQIVHILQVANILHNTNFMQTPILICIKRYKKGIKTPINRQLTWIPSFSNPLWMASTWFTSLWSQCLFQDIIPTGWSYNFHNFPSPKGNHVYLYTHAIVVSNKYQNTTTTWH